MGKEINMLDLIKKIMGDKGGDKKLTGTNEQDAQVALCVLLLEAAHSDGECSADEMDHVIATLTDRFGVARQDIEPLIEAGYKERDDAIDLFRFTRYMNSNYSKKEKIEAMESVWRVIHTDGRLEAHEDHFAHKLENLLRLTHKEMINAKIAARKQLE
jgi:uncharacterized tellurite resistance protein B-like protein